MCHSRVPALCLTAVWVLNCVSLCRTETALPPRLPHPWLLVHMSDAGCHCQAARRSCEDVLAGTFLRRKGDFRGGEDLIRGAFPRESWGSLQGHWVQPHRSSEKALSWDLEQEGLKGPKKLSSHQRASFRFSHIPSLRVEAHLAQVRQQSPPHQSDTGFGVLQ